MSFDVNGYPTEETLKEIESFKINKELSNLPDYLSLIFSHWEYPEWGILYNRSSGILELHTAGWSGNESIVCSMKKTFMFWSLFWCKSTRGGHYYFELFQFDDAGKKCNPKFDVFGGTLVW